MQGRARFARPCIAFELRSSRVPSHQHSGGTDMATSNKKGDVLQQLREGITKLTSSDAWFRYLDVQRRFHQYSWGNCLLIAIQRPEATRVAGYHAWQQLNRQVNVGEKGIRILAPVTCKKSTSATPDTNPDASP